LFFDRSTIDYPALSPRHYREGMEATAAPVQKISTMLASDPAKLATFRGELEAIIADYFWDNLVHQGYLMSRATKR
jgi:hypothetical protein